MNEKVESRVASNEKKYRLMIDRYVDSIWVVDAFSLKYLYISPDIYKIRGFTQEELIGKHIKKSFTEDSFNRIKELAIIAKKDYDSGTNKTYLIEVEVYHKDGSTIWLEITAKYIKENDEPLKIIGIARNIDKRKKEEEKKVSLNLKLQRALKEKEKLLKEVERLESLLPICSGCKRIRCTDNSWWPLEKYFENHSKSKFSHTICPDCRDIYYPELKKGE